MPARARSGAVRARWRGSQGAQSPLLRAAQGAQIIAERNSESQLKAFEGQWLPHQVDFMSLDAPEKLLRLGNQGTKAQPLDAKILTPDGWKRMGDIRVGDEVIAGDGTITQVTGVYPQGVKQIYRVTFEDGATTECCADHLWKVQDGEARFRKATDHAGASARLGQWQVLPLATIMDRWGMEPTPRRRVAIPVVGAAPGRRNPVRLDPYLLGVLLGDGGFRDYGVTLSSADSEIVAAVERILLPSGTELKHINRYDYRITTGTMGGDPRSRPRNFVLDELRALGLGGKGSHEKFVPDAYKHNNRDTRLSVLQGLMDTDGTVGDHGTISFTSTSEQLAQDVLDLVRSLGGKGRIVSRETTYTYKGEKRSGRTAYTVRIRISGVPVFRLKRKLERCHDSSRTQNRVLHRIEPTRMAEAQCIRVAHPDHTYVTDDYIVTHNTTTGLAEVYYRCTGKHPFIKVPQRPIEAWIVCASWSQSVAIQKKFWELVPKEDLDPSVKFNPERGFRGKNPVVKFKNGSIVRFKTTRQGALNLASATIDLVLIDELPTLRVYTELLKRVMFNGGQIILTLTPVNAPSAWLQKRVAEGHIVERHWRFTPALFVPMQPGETLEKARERLRTGKVPDGAEPIRSADANGRVVVKDAAWVAEQIAKTPEEEREVVCHGEWPAGDVERELRAFDNKNKFDGTRLPRFVAYGLGLDHGEKAGREVALFVAWTVSGELWVLGEYVSTGESGLDGDADGIRDMVESWGLTLDQIDVAVGDINSAGQLARGMSVNEYLEGRFAAMCGGQRPFRIDPADKTVGVDERIIVLNTAFAGKRIRVHEDCQILIRACQMWRGKNNRLKDPIDALGYVYGKFVSLRGPRARKVRLAA
jgi:phage terminase large subunit-like protein